MKQTVNQRVKLLRETFKLTQSEFADLTEHSHSLIAKAEANGSISPKFERKILSLNVSKEWLENGKGQMFSSGTNEENIENVQSLLRKLQSPQSVTTQAPVNPWQDEAYTVVKEENTSLREQVKMLMQTVMNLTGGKGPVANFIKALDGTGATLYNLNGKKRVAYSGAKAA